MIKIFISLLLVISLSYSFDKDQMDIIRKSYNIGKLIKAKDGMTFENTLASISFTESSAGKYIIGDKFTKHLKDSSLGVYQIRLKTAKWLIKSDPWLRKNFTYLLKDDNRLISMILRREEFGALLAGHLLKIWYNYALKKDIKNPWFYAVSRYNGGVHNTVYVARIRKNIKLIKKII